jgi:hypothetical protein
MVQSATSVLHNSDIKVSAALSDKLAKGTLGTPPAARFLKAQRAEGWRSGASSAARPASRRRGRFFVDPTDFFRLFRFDASTSVIGGDDAA